ncbi:hypothetical protein [Cribrihabitans neustonicus]|uniref:hypothetical protein n=1 Tax=Cribrihabitans neustonicus TaxID=1429085 RepID=UPI003B58ED31
MPVSSKVFTYEAEGLSYTVTVYEEAGQFFADIAVTEGAMDVNAIYLGDDDFSGPSESLRGPLNMNGARLGGEDVQWDSAVELSRPGLGREGADKETYVETGDTLTVSLDIGSLDVVDVFGIRATSTTTDAGSIKAVSSNPEEPEDPEEPEEPQDPTYEKVFFGEVFSETGDPLGGAFILDEEPDPNPYSIPALPEGTEPTFENFLSYYLSDEVGGDVEALEGIVFYGSAADGTLEEQFRISAPEGGFQDAEELLAAYDTAVSGGSDADAYAAEDLMAALSLGEDALEAPNDDEALDAEEFDLA